MHRVIRWVWSGRFLLPRFVSLGVAGALLIPFCGRAQLPPVQVFVPGVSVRELPVQLSNLNNVEYAPDGRLFAAGYDGRLHLLRDTNGDGLEDSITTFGEQPGGDYPLGIAVHSNAVFVVFRNEVARFTDSDGDGVPDRREVALKDWDDPDTLAEGMFLKRRVDYAMGFAIGPDGWYYLGLGNAAYDNPYLVDKQGVSHYRRPLRRGCVLRISPDGRTVEQYVTGVRYLMCLQFNRHGDLLASEQEGATWLPNGNPFDELLHLERGRHYGFPPRHPKYLPDVIDEPSTFDYAPQHQSVCGFRLNETLPSRARFGPEAWEGDAFVTGFTRGKLYRTKLIRTPAGYVAQNQLLASLQTLPSDCAFSPRGELLVATHTGKPDWGTGPKGIGRMFKLSSAGSSNPVPVLTYPVSPTETRIEFDRPLRLEDWKDSIRQTAMESGVHVAAGDRFETIRPGYKVVEMQQLAVRFTNRIESVVLSQDRRTVSVRTAPRTTAGSYAITLPDPYRRGVSVGLPQMPAIDLGHDLSGVAAEWVPTQPGSVGDWQGWIPHLDLEVTRALTQFSAGHSALPELARQPGLLRLRAQLDLSMMLRPATQPGSKLDFEYPAESVTVAFESQARLDFEVDPSVKVVRHGPKAFSLVIDSPRADQWIPVTIRMATDPLVASRMSVHWFTREDPRPRALPLRRILMPWAVASGKSAPTNPVPEIAGGDWTSGKALFHGEQLACGRCHQVRGEGGKVGPDLSNLIHRDYASVLKDILRPNATLNPDHLAQVVELQNGESKMAVIADETPTRLILVDSSGLRSEVDKTVVVSRKPSELSLMPEGLLEKLNQNETRDLLTFLLTEGPVSPSQ